MFSRESYLPNHYRNCNSATGHSSGCAYGAGGDCTCGFHEELLEDEFDILYADGELPPEMYIYKAAVLPTPPPSVFGDDDIPF